MMKMPEAQNWYLLGGLWSSAGSSRVPAGGCLLTDDMTGTSGRLMRAAGPPRRRRPGGYSAPYEVRNERLSDPESVTWGFPDATHTFPEHLRPRVERSTFQLQRRVGLLNDAPYRQ